MSPKRKGEDVNYPFRSQRIFTVGSEWYFTTREGKDVGPFKNKEDTEGELLLYLRGIAPTWDEDNNNKNEDD